MSYLDYDYCPICEDELSPYHEERMGHLYHEGLRLFMALPSVQTELIQAADGEWWFFKWMPDYDMWQLVSMEPINAATAAVLAEAYIATLGRSIEKIEAEQAACRDFIDEI